MNKKRIYLETAYQMFNDFGNFSLLDVQKEMDRMMSKLKTIIGSKQEDEYVIEPIVEYGPSDRYSLVGFDIFALKDPTSDEMRTETEFKIKILRNRIKEAQDELDALNKT